MMSRALIVLGMMLTASQPLGTTTQRAGSPGPFAIFANFIAPSPALAVEETISVEFSQPQARTRSMSGLLHGLSETTPRLNAILPLRPKQWRVGAIHSQDGLTINPTVYNRIVQSEARIQLVLSDF
jgi:hypothetical protein